MTTEQLSLNFDAVKPEEWRPVVGYENLYEVSDQGQVRSLDRYVATVGNPSGKRLLRSAPMKFYIHNKVYHGVRLSREGRHRLWLVHRLVLEAFVGPCPSSCQCCHYDGNGLNNKLENLRWGDQASNEKDKIRHNGKHNAAHLTVDQVREIRERLKTWNKPLYILANEYGVLRQAIKEIKIGKSWAWLP